MTLRAVTRPLLAAAVLLATACGSGAQSRLDGDWILVDADGLAGVAQPMDAGISLDINGSELSGSSGCNVYAGDAKVQGSLIEVGELLLTRKACSEAGVMDVEQAYLGALQRAASWEIASGVLRLQGDETTLVFARRPD
jgi:heat shock protein HslJ